MAKSSLFENDSDVQAEIMNVYYKVIAYFYDLIDAIYFRKNDNSLRKVVLDAISERNTILDICTGTGTTSRRIVLIRFFSHWCCMR